MEPAWNSVAGVTGVRVVPSTAVAARRHDAAVLDDGERHARDPPSRHLLLDVGVETVDARGLATEPRGRRGEGEGE
jgi:hypothetical protein